MALKPWTLPTIAANTTTDWVVPSASKEVAIVGISICNTGTVYDADVTVTLTDSANTTKATVLKGTLAPGESVHVDTKVFIKSSTAPDKLRALSTIASVSFLASGDES